MSYGYDARRKELRANRRESRRRGKYGFWEIRSILKTKLKKNERGRRHKGLDRVFYKTVTQWFGV